MKNIFFIFIIFVALIIITSCFSAFSGFSGSDINYTDSGEHITVRDYSSDPEIKAGTEDVSRYRTGEPHVRALGITKQMVDDVRSNPVQNLSRLVEKLTAGVTDPFERVKIIHDWIALNVEYDMQSYEGGSIPNQSYIYVLKTGKAVCSGFSTLFQIMCETAEIPCQVIRGYGRGIDYDPFDDNEEVETNHDWCAVKINRGWYFVDVTWDGNIFSDTGEYFSQYLFTAPAMMIHSHLPINSRWQLLEKPLSAKVFLDQPEFNPVFFTVFGDAPPAGLKKRQKVKEEYVLELPPVNARYEVVFALFDGVSLKTVQTQSLKNIPHCVKVEYMEDKTVVHILFPAKKTYRLDFSCKLKSAKTGTSGIIFGTLIFENAKPAKHSFPEIASAVDYSDFRPQIISPVYGPLVAGSTYTFHFIQPEATNCSVAYMRGKKAEFLKSCAAVDGKGTFRFQITVPTDAGGYTDKTEGLIHISITAHDKFLGGVGYTCIKQGH
jgi:hypothetical protein